MTNKGWHPYDAAKQYGTLVSITEGRVSIQNTDRLQHEIVTVIDTSDKEDWLLVSGSGIITALCIGYWLRRHDKVKVLFWDSLLKNYREREFTFNPEEFRG